MKRLLLIPLFAAALMPTAFAQAPAASSVPEDPPPVLAVPNDYRYNSRARRDPFINPVPKPVGAAAAVVPTTRPPGLKGILVSEAAVAGVVISKEPSMNVVIIGSAAGKSYFARIGDELYDAVVKEIRLDTITFAMNQSSAKDAPREIVLKMRPTSGE